MSTNRLQGNPMDVTGHITGREIVFLALYALIALTLIGLVARRSNH